MLWGVFASVRTYFCRRPKNVDRETQMSYFSWNICLASSIFTYHQVLFCFLNFLPLPVPRIITKSFFPGVCQLISSLSYNAWIWFITSFDNTFFGVFLVTQKISLLLKFSFNSRRIMAFFFDRLKHRAFNNFWNSFVEGVITWSL